jgi:ATP-binding cassette, subfamily B, multidrug efflux pump
LKLIYPYFKKNLNKILLGILCMIIVDAAQIIVPQIIKNIIDKLAVHSFDKNTLFLQSVFILILGLAMAGLRYGWRNLLMGSARSVEKSIRDKLFRRILNLDMAYLDKVKTGDIMAHAISDINHIRMAFGFGLIVLTDIILLGGATLAIMIWTHPELTLFAMIPMPLLIIVTKTLGNKMHSYHTDAQKSFSTLTELVRESFSGIRIIKVFNYEDLTGKKVHHSATNYFKKNLKRAFITALLRPMLIVFFNLSTLIIIFYGGFLVMQNKLSPGELAAFLQYLGILAWPIIAIGWITNLFQRGMASLKRVNLLLDTKLDVDSPRNPTDCSKISGNIIFNNLSFSYDKKQPDKQSDYLTLKNINLKVNRGDRIGITGKPGSGKTSLIQLIPRLYNPVKGTILIDDIDIQTIDLKFLRKNIALMPQEAFLFSGTIKENILLGKPCDKTKLDQIIDVCCLNETLKKMHLGLDTLVGERGVTLSGGQKQRIALARTLITKKPVIILDDPISQMDTDTASRVILRLNRLNLEASLIIISHRISALAPCDRIYILNQGEIETFGTHKELVKNSDFYRTSYETQQLKWM